MSKFKKGDVVRRIESNHEGMVVGEIATVEWYEEDFSALGLKGYKTEHSSNCFELVQCNAQELAEFRKMLEND